MSERARPSFDGTRCFVNNVDEYIPGAVCSELSLQGNVFLSGTLRGGHKCGQVPPCVKRLLSRASPSEFLANVLQHDVIVYDLHATDLEELEFVLNAFTAFDFRHPVSLVLVSSLMTWARTPCEGPASGPGTVPATAINKRWKEGFNHREPRILTDTEHETRVPSVRFADWKSFELSWAALSKKTNVRSVVVGAGLPYGNGEYIFQDWFAHCWNSMFEKNTMIGDGTNYLPVVHCRNLARFTRYATFAPVDARQSYYVACDQQPSTQRQLLEAVRLAFEEEDPRLSKAKDQDAAVPEGGDPISEEARNFTLSNVLHGSVHVEQAILMDNADLLTMNLRFRPSAEMYQFANWGGEQGMLTNSKDTLAQEYALWRGLTPLRVVLAGAPGTYQQYLPQIAAYFGVEVLTVKGIVTEYLEREERQLWLRLKEHEAYMLANPAPEEGTEAFEEYEPVPEPALSETAQKAQEWAGGFGDAVENSIPADLLETVRGLFQQKFAMCRCMTKGFVLDSWPVTGEEAAELFSELRYIPPVIPDTKTSSGRSSRPGTGASRRTLNSQSPEKTATASEAPNSEAPNAEQAGEDGAGEAAKEPEEPQGTYERFLLPGCPDVLFLFSADEAHRSLECELLSEEQLEAAQLTAKLETRESSLLTRIQEQKTQQTDVIDAATEENPLPEDFVKLTSVRDFFQTHNRLCECDLNAFYEEFAIWGKEEMDFRNPPEEEPAESPNASPTEEAAPEPTEEELALQEKKRLEAEARKEDRRVKREHMLSVVKGNAFVKFFQAAFEKSTGKPFKNFLQPLDTTRVPVETPVSEGELVGLSLEESPEEIAEREAAARAAAQKAEAERKYQDKLRREEEAQLEEVSEPLRKYLAEYVTPHVTEALIEICRVMPEDPVDYLAEYLFFKSEEMKGPDSED
ncbi:unnamed protein product [Amoebophrya sp. A120]|nr:unnamed protein product [Amoebophrya sp. A120]|eukprot:GSA120T00010873001.1